MPKLNSIWVERPVLHPYPAGDVDRTAGYRFHVDKDFLIVGIYQVNLVGSGDGVLNMSATDITAHLMQHYYDTVPIVKGYRYVDPSRIFPTQLVPLLGLADLDLSKFICPAGDYSITKIAGSDLVSRQFRVFYLTDF